MSSFVTIDLIFLAVFNVTPRNFCGKNERNLERRILSKRGLIKTKGPG